MNSQISPSPTAPDAASANPDAESTNDWMPVLRRIAQRADELWSKSGGGPSRDLECWLQAEHEIFGQNDLYAELSASKPAAA